MTSKVRFKKERRTFLNPEGMAAIKSHVSYKDGVYTHKGIKEKPFFDLEADLTVSDCSRMVTLDFSCYNKKHVAKIDRKFKKVINNINQFYEDWKEQAKRIK